MPNIKDIAELAGVSVATVSRTLKKPEVVREETRRVVMAAVAKLEYKPNALASGLRRQRSETIIVVVPDIRNPFYSSIVQGIEHVAHSSGYKILLGESQNRQDRLDSYAGMLMSKEADGLILLGSLLPTLVQESLAQGREVPIPLVMACEYFEGLEIPNVRIDNVGAAALATTYLLDLGHARIAKITGPMNNPLSKDRLKGYRSALRKAGLRALPDYVGHGDFSVDSGYRAMQALLALEEPPTAVFCSNDEMAIGALKAIKDQKLRVPRDISIIGFDNIRFSEYSDPPLTTISQPNTEIGRTAMRLMLDCFQGGIQSARTIVLPHELVVRASTARFRDKP